MSIEQNLLAALEDRLDRNDEQGAIDLARTLLREGVPHAEILKASVPAAARALELKYPTPHAMIALDWTWETLPRMSIPQRDVVLESFTRHLAGVPKASLSVGPQEAVGEPHESNLEEGLLGSLAAHRVFDAFFHAAKLVRKSGSSAAAKPLGLLSSNEVDSLGHCFIHTATALRLFEKCGRDDRPLVLLSSLEYLSRRALHEAPEMLFERRALGELIPGAFERINILGHNVIFAAELAKGLEAFPSVRRAHLLGQLARNIEASEAPLAGAERELVETAAPGGDGEALERNFERGDTTAALKAAAGVEALEACGRLIVLFARINTRQPHYFIYPAATLSLLEGLDGGTARLAIAQLVKMGSEAAAKHGVRPKA